MKRFILKILLFISPIVALLGIYVCADPLYVIWDYDDYTQTQSPSVSYNSYKMLMQYDSIPFNSFIVGSSRSGFWPWKEWEKHLDYAACAFHLESSGDGVYNALERLRFAYENIEHVDNVLLIVDAEWLSKDYPLTGIQYRTPWQMKNESDFFAFHADAVKFLLSIEGFNATFISPTILNDTLIAYRDTRNENHLPEKERLINTNPEYYYAQLDESIKLFPRSKNEKVGNVAISDKGKNILSELHQLFITGNTEYKIVISPLYDQIKLNPQDKEVLDSIFGEENVFDYSGISKYTKDTLNYYEYSHYRPCVTIRILQEIYNECNH